jgi:hypothetical protein
MRGTARPLDIRDALAASDHLPVIAFRIRSNPTHRNLLFPMSSYHPTGDASSPETAPKQSPQLHDMTAPLDWDPRNASRFACRRRKRSNTCCHAPGCRALRSIPGSVASIPASPAQIPDCARHGNAPPIHCCRRRICRHIRLTGGKFPTFPVLCSNRHHGAIATCCRFITI